MVLRGFILLSLFIGVSGHAESPFEKAARQREAARQRAFDRGQRTALPAEEAREAIGRLPESARQTLLSADGKPVSQSPPSAAVYNRVMETARHFRDPDLSNANDSFTDDPQIAEKLLAEARVIYPDLAKPDSLFALRFAVLQGWVDARQPPLANDARRDMLLAHMVSLEIHGTLRKDSMGLGQIDLEQPTAAMKPIFAKHGAFEVTIQGSVAQLPGGAEGAVTAGQAGSGDTVVWLDSGGQHSLIMPLEKTGTVILFGSDLYKFSRSETLSGYRIRFTP